MILDFSKIFYSVKRILKIGMLMTGIILEMYGTIFHYTELTPLRKVRQNKPFGLISYSTVLTRFFLEIPLPKFIKIYDTYENNFDTQRLNSQNVSGKVMAVFPINISPSNIFLTIIL